MKRGCNDGFHWMIIGGGLTVDGKGRF